MFRDSLILDFGIADRGLGNPKRGFTIGSEGINDYGGFGEKIGDKSGKGARAGGYFPLRQQSGRERRDIENRLLILAGQQLAFCPLTPRRSAASGLGSLLFALGLTKLSAHNNKAIGECQRR